LFYAVPCVLPRAMYSINDRFRLVFTSLLTRLLTHILTVLPIFSHTFSPLSNPSPISLGRPPFLVSTPGIHIHICRVLQAMNTEKAKGCWRGLNPDEQIEAALRDGLSLISVTSTNRTP
jgi:hypothetical protein